MAQQKMLLGHVKGDTGPKGDTGKIDSATVTIDTESLEQPTATVEVSGQAGAQTMTFTFHGLKGQKGDQGNPGATGDKGADAKIVSATATADAQSLDEPTVTVDVGGEPGNQTLTFSFSGLKGAKGDAGPKGDAGSPGADGAPGKDGTNATTTATATQGANGLMSSADKKKLDSITGGSSSNVVLANGTTLSIATMLQNNVETIRTALGVVTKTKNGLVPKLPADANAVNLFLDSDLQYSDPASS